MGLAGYITMHIFMILEIISFFLLPSIIETQGLGLMYSIFAGWVVGFITPSVALSHEMVHLNSKKWYTKAIWYINIIVSYIWVVVLHHRYSHHRYANSLKDFGHPYKNRNRIEYFFDYLIKPLPYLFKKEPFYATASIILSFVSTLIIYKLFSFNGVLFQIFSVLGFYYTTGAGNYVQHYGLELLPISDKEKLNYAWDDISILGHYFGFNLHVHSDHHMNPLKPFDQLKHPKGKPMVPYGTPLMMFLLLLPGNTFHKIMNKRLDEYLKRF